METLENGILEITVSERGAELQSLYKITSNREYLWQGDERYWERRSPLLFPIIGKTHDQQILIDGLTYSMPKHGFAQNLLFECQTDDRLLHLTATDTEETFRIFPFNFRIEILYKLSRNTLTVTQRIMNTGTNIMPFQVGFHPAFNLPMYNPSDTIHGYLSFNTDDEIKSNIIEQGFLTDKLETYPLDNRYLPIVDKLFDYDTIVDTRGVVERTTLYDKNKKPLLTVKSKAPVTAYWSPVQKAAPFICIEPWQGCCEDLHFKGEMSSRRFMNKLKENETFEFSMQIIIE